MGKRGKRGSRGDAEVDRAVGGRMRERRILVGMSQEELGGHLGISFQQVQKYEKGTNRVSAGRLWQLSKVLQVPLNYFFGIPEGNDAPQPLGHTLSRESLELVRDFLAIGDQRMRNHLRSLVHSISQREAA